jgi:hypothetical protein
MDPQCTLGLYDSIDAYINNESCRLCSSFSDLTSLNGHLRKNG